MDTGAQMSCISEQWAREKDLKPYIRKYPKFIAGIGPLRSRAKGAYWVRYTLRDSVGVVREHYRPFLAVEREPDEAPLLIGKPDLQQIGVDIHLRPEGVKWQYSLHKVNKPFVKVESEKKFKKRLRKSPKIYALVATNHLIQSTTKGPDELDPRLKDYLDVFSPANAEKLPPNRPEVDIAIELQEGKHAPYGPLYPLSAAELEVLRQYIQENLDKGFIRPSKSPAASPVLFVPKKDGSLRLCVDYRGLNSVTVKNRYPLPLVGEIMDRVNGAQWFSKIDLKDAYHRIRIQPGDEWKTAFRTRYGHFEYLVMPFGLTNAPATFQAFINHALRRLVDDFCIVYLDDILIFSKTEDEHTQHLKQVCERLRTAELYAKPTKCRLYQREMEFLGFIISPKGVAMDPNRVKIISEWKDHPPLTYRDVQVILGFCNFYRRFIRNYSRIARPLTALLKGSKNGKKKGDLAKEWGNKERQAFLSLLGSFETAPLLRHYDPDLPSRVETDASDYALGSIFSQLFEDGWHPVAFYSRQFKGAEIHYSTPDKEMLAIVESFKHWRHYLEGNKHSIEVLTDHHNLQSFMKQTRLNGRQARWCYYLTPFDFVIHYRTGTANPADAPSRWPGYKASQPEKEDCSALLATLDAKLARVQEVRVNCLRQVLGSAESERCTGKYNSRGLSPNSALIASTGSYCAGMVNEGSPQGEDQEADHLLHVIRVQVVTRKRAREATRNETQNPLAQTTNDLKKLIAAVQATDPFSQRLIKEVREVGNTRTQFTLSLEGLLLWKERIFVPQQRSLISELLNIYHDNPQAGHWGVEKTLELLQRKFKWSGMRADVEEYVKTCPVCQGISARRHAPYGNLVPLPHPSRPWAEISMDWITGLPPSFKGDCEYNSILTIVDRYTKMAIFLPVKDTMDAAEMAELLYNELECRFGPPTGIVSDRDSRITSQFWADLCYYSVVKRKLSTAFHPQTDGQSEILNRIVENYLRAFTSLEQMNWAKLLPTASFAYNNSLNHTLKTTPFRAMYGYDPDFHVDFDVRGDIGPGRAPAARDRVKKLQELRDSLKGQWAKAQERQKKYYDQRHQSMEFKRGSLVKLSTSNLRLKDKKLQPRYIGPFRVTERIGSQAYRLALPNQYSRLHDVFPIQLLEPYHSRDHEEPLPMPDLEDDQEEYEVEEIKDKALMKGKIRYLVKWAGWPSEYNQWVNEEDMGNAQARIKEFERKKKAKVKNGKRQEE
jgi:RNase H-like domain found in reverse transcriptase/Reverse transcriptase (RNA-dependent DNA polymerase)/Integrase zinc binding domain/Chromo (CHRromatin Organisation MOdifier) domain/Integrase core domain